MFIISQIKNIFQKKPKVIVVLGQTSTGKSDIAVEIAQKYDGEIISADSRQVYRGMDLGSGKITKAEMQGIPHYLLDVADPIDIFDVTQFQKIGTEVLQNILKRGKIPIICGGTGFYIDALVYQTQFSSVKPNRKLRTELDKLSLTELQKIYREKISSFRFKLRSLFFNLNIFHYKKNQNFKKIDMKNRMRIIRAIEIINELGYIPKNKKSNPYNILYIGMTLEKEPLNKRIYTRIIKRLDNGMLDEVYTLLKNGVTHERLQSLGLEYKFMSKHILGEISYDMMINQLYQATVHFSKRQKTWFKRNKDIHWFNYFDTRKNLFELIDFFLRKE